MEAFQILFHGQFAPAANVVPHDGKEREAIPYEGFYGSRVISAADLASAIIRGKELIRQELENTILHGRQEALTLLEAEEWEKVHSRGGLEAVGSGFTFY